MDPERISVLPSLQDLVGQHFVDLFHRPGPLPPAPPISQERGGALAHQDQVRSEIPIEVEVAERGLEVGPFPPIGADLLLRPELVLSLQDLEARPVVVEVS